MLLLATRQQVKPTLRCCFQSTGPVVDLLPPPSLYSIPWTRRLSSADASVVFVVVFVLIFLRRCLRHRLRFPRPVVYPPPPPLLSLILRTCRIFLVLFRHLRRRRCVCEPVLLFHRRRHCSQYPGPVNAPAPPPLETFTQTRCIFFFLN